MDGRETALVQTFVALADTLVDDYDVVELAQQMVDDCVTLLAVDSAGRFSVAKLGIMPDECLIETEVFFTHGTQSLGLLLHASEDLTKYYQVRLEPARHRMVVDRWPRPGDQPFIVERPLTIREGHPVRLRIIADGTCLVVYANDEVALSCRMYDHRHGGLGLFASEGEAQFREVSVKGR